MYDTHMDVGRPLVQLDDALLRLRRLWSSPPPSLVVEGKDVTMSSVLVLEACAHTHTEVGVREIARFLEVEHSTASRFVDRAVRAGLVTRGASATDSRRVALTPTASGQQVRERAVRFRLTWLAGVLSGWGEEEVAELSAGLTRFADAVADAAPPASQPTAPHATPLAPSQHVRP